MSELKYMREILKDSFQGEEFSSIPDMESKFENLSKSVNKVDLQIIDEKIQTVLSSVVPRFIDFTSKLAEARSIKCPVSSKDSNSSKYFSSTEAFHEVNSVSNKRNITTTTESTVETRNDQCSGYMSMTPLAQSTPRNSSSHESFKRHLENLDKGETVNMVEKMDEKPVDVGSSRYLISSLEEYVDEIFNDTVKNKFMNLMRMLDDGTGTISCVLVDNLLENCPHLFLEA